MTRTAHDPIELLREASETQLHQYTDRLTELAVSKRQPDGGGHDADMLAELIASCGQTVSDTAQALQRMAEGTYGVCERCEADIPLPRLEILPHARFCVPCQGGPPRLMRVGLGQRSVAKGFSCQATDGRGLRLSHLRVGYGIEFMTGAVMARSVRRSARSDRHPPMY